VPPALRRKTPLLVGLIPVLVKTAIAEGLARNNRRGETPEVVLSNNHLYSLDIGGVAGRHPAYRGDFEERLRPRDELESPLKTPDWFIDEIHTVIGAGCKLPVGPWDASNLLKPALGGGKLRTMGYYDLQRIPPALEKDRALAVVSKRSTFNELRREGGRNSARDSNRISRRSTTRSKYTPTRIPHLRLNWRTLYQRPQLPISRFDWIDESRCCKHSAFCIQAAHGPSAQRSEASGRQIGAHPAQDVSKDM